MELSRKPECFVVSAGCALVILLAVVGAMWNLRGLVTSEVEAAMAATNARLESAAASIRQDIREGRESSDRQMAEIRRFIFELNSEEDDNDGDADGSRN